MIAELEPENNAPDLERRQNLLEFNRGTYPLIKWFIESVRKKTIHTNFEFDEPLVRLKKCRMANFQPNNPEYGGTADAKEWKLIDDIISILHDLT